MNDKISNINELRDFMADCLKNLKTGENTAATANAMANVAGKILGSVKLELEYSKMVGATPHIEFIKTINSKVNKLEHKKHEKK